MIQVHGRRAVNQFPPLPVAVGLGWEGGEDRMRRVTEDAQRVGCLVARPCRVPEDAGEADLARRSERWLGREGAARWRLARPARASSMSLVTRTGAGAALALVGKDPEIPVVLVARAILCRHTDNQRVFVRRARRRPTDNAMPHNLLAAHRNRHRRQDAGTGRRCRRCPPAARSICAAVSRGAAPKWAIWMSARKVSPVRQVALRHARQRDGAVAEAARTLAA